MSSAGLISRLMKLALKNVDAFKVTDKLYLNNTLASIHSQVKRCEGRGRTKHEAMMEALARTLPGSV